MSKRISRVGSVLVAGILGALLLVAPAAPSTRGGANVRATKLVVWSDQDRKAAVDKVVSAWGAARGVEVEVVVKGFGDIRDNLKTVQPDNAPDVIVGAHDWTGSLAASGLVLPLFPSKSLKGAFPAYTLEAFS